MVTIETLTYTTLSAPEFGAQRFQPPVMLQALLVPGRSGQIFIVQGHCLLLFLKATAGFKVPKYTACVASVLGIMIVVWGIYFIFGKLGPFGQRMSSGFCVSCCQDGYCHGAPEGKPKTAKFQGRIK